MSRTAETHQRVKEEILREKAAALGRAGERVEAALAEATRLGEALDRATEARPRARLAREYERARAHARSVRLDLVIQREALGLRHHAVVEQQFPLPPPPRARRQP